MRGTLQRSFARRRGRSGSTSPSLSSCCAALLILPSVLIIGASRPLRAAEGAGLITTLASDCIFPARADGRPAYPVGLHWPSGVAVDDSGNVYVADTYNSRICEVSAATGVITTVVGDGSGGDGGPAIGASLSFPYGVAVDGSGNIYIADTGNHRIRKVSAETGVITTVAGNGNRGYSGDGGPATSATLAYIWGVAVDRGGNIYIVDGGQFRVYPGNDRIRKVSADTGVITTVAGGGGSIFHFGGDGGPATSATLYLPQGVAVDGSGNIYIADTYNARIRKVSADTGVITTVAGNGYYIGGGDGGPATSVGVPFPYGVAIDGSGNIYIISGGIRKVSAATGVITTVVGGGGGPGIGDGGPATSASLGNPQGIAVDASGNIYIADTYNNRIRKVEQTVSATLLSSNANPTTTQNLVLTATVSPADATGSVKFFDVTTSLGSVALSGGTATLYGLLLTAGSHVLSAVYNGDANYPTSTSPAIWQSISARAFSTLTLISDGQPIQSGGQTVYVSILNNPATFTATIAPAEASGTVQFFDGAMSLGIQTPSAGTSVFTTSSLPVGNHTITAIYSGDALFMPRWAAPLRQQVQNAASGNSVNASPNPR